MSTAKLVSDSQMVQLRSVAELGMQSTVVIYKRTFNDTNPYSDDEVVATTATTTVKGWLRTVPVGDLTSIDGQIAVATSHRLFVPVGTDIASNDRVSVDGIMYTVQETTVTNTWRVLIRCQLERVE